jgi:hypothetical protein
MRRLFVALIGIFFCSLAHADIIGQARVVDGDTLYIGAALWNGHILRPGRRAPPPPVAPVRATRNRLPYRLRFQQLTDSY